MPNTATESGELRLALEPRAESARVARHALTERGLSEDIEHTVALLVTEIVGNAVRHANLESEQRIELWASVGADYARVEVVDPGPGFDPRTVESDGYGLRLVAKLASRWGVEVGEGCRVWFEIDRRNGRFER